MAGCGKEVDYTVPTKYSHKTLKYHCGNTGIDGFPVLCDECAEKLKDVDWRAEAAANGENFDEEY
jgi:hypothetical protein